ncbi:MAG: ATP-binding protein [bacterium]|nr:ATP-binding protein [bacterium]
MNTRETIETIEEREEFARKMEWLIIARFVLYGLATIIAVIKMLTGVDPFSLFFVYISVSIFILNFIYLFLIRKRLYLYFVAYISLGIDILFITIAVHFQGGLAATIFPINYLVLILVASIFISTRAGIIITTLSSITVTALITLECLNILPPVHVKGITMAIYQEKGYVIAVMLARIIFFYAAAIVSGYLSDRIKMQTRQIREKEAQLIYAERMTVATRIAEESAHEIKNPLAVIKAGLYYLKHILPENNEAQQIILKMDDAGQRAVNYFDDLLHFFRPPRLERSSVNINEVIKKALAELPDEVFANIEVQQELSSRLPDILADSERLEQVVINLVKNAAEAMAGVSGKWLVIRSEQEGEFIKIIVSDTGKGIPEESLKHIFDPFFTTKGKGTGLGLSICQRIVEAHDGSIEVASKMGEGTTFVVRLPIQ